MRTFATIVTVGVLIAGFGALGASEARGDSGAQPVADSLTIAVSGEGEPAVLIPGLCASAFAFRDLIPRLHEAGYQIIVIEPLGVGSSPRPKKAPTVRTSGVSLLRLLGSALPRGAPLRAS